MGDFNYFGLARLRPGQANEEINALQRTISAGLPSGEKGTLSAVLTSFQQALIGSNRMPLVILLAAVAGLLLVGCINITNLLLARSVGRRHQIAIAAALGASGREILRMAMRETAVIAAMGGVLGIVLAAVLVPVMQHYLPVDLDFRGALHLDWMGAASALLLAIMATLLAGAVPAWISSGTQPHDVLHSESRLASESRGSKRVRSVLVAVEAGDTWIDMIRVPGDARPFMQIPSEHFRWVSPDYFAALHLPLINGRFLTTSDQGKRDALISELTAHSLWPGKDPVGQQFSRAGVPDEPPFTVVGIVGDARTISLAKPDPMMGICHTGTAVTLPVDFSCARGKTQRL